MHEPGRQASGRQTCDRIRDDFPEPEEGSSPTLKCTAISFPVARFNGNLHTSHQVDVSGSSRYARIASRALTPISPGSHRV